MTFEQIDRLKDVIESGKRLYYAWDNYEARVFCVSQRGIVLLEEPMTLGRPVTEFLFERFYFIPPSEIYSVAPPSDDATETPSNRGIQKTKSGAESQEGAEDERSKQLDEARRALNALYVAINGLIAKFDR